MALNFLSFKHGGKTESPVMPVTDFGLNHCHKRTLQLGRRTVSGNVGYTDADICDNVPICHRHLPRYSHLPLVAAPGSQGLMIMQQTPIALGPACRCWRGSRGGEGRSGRVGDGVGMCCEWWRCATSGGDVLQVYMGRYSVMDCSCV